MDQEIHIRTLTVTRTEMLSRPDGRAALAFWTEQTKPFAIELDQRSIDTLGLQLGQAEAMLNAKPGHA
jgi:hypothetical protein